MLSRLFGHRSPDRREERGERSGAPLRAPAVALPAGGRPEGGRPEGGRPEGGRPEGELPAAAELLDAWRQEVAQVALELAERHRLVDTERSHAERLLVRLAVDLEFVIRQPSQAAQEAFAVASDPGCELPALVAIVERDPSLARAVLRHAASAAVGAVAPPRSLDDAVRRLGATGVQIAVLAGLAESLLARPAALYSPMAPQVWGHMVRTGPRARALARAFDVPPDEAFTLGLLHDVGKLVLFDLVAAMREELRREVHIPPALAAEALRRLHEPLGGMALLRWGVHPRAAWAVATHHRERAPAATATTPPRATGGARSCSSPSGWTSRCTRGGRWRSTSGRRRGASPRTRSGCARQWRGRRPPDGLTRRHCTVTSP